MREEQKKGIQKEMDRLKHEKIKIYTEFAVIFIY